MQRIMVDLPDPEGPHTTMRSRRSTARLMSRSTWKSPYHLCTPTISIATLLRVVCRVGSPVAPAVSVIIPPLAPVAAVQAPLEEQRVARHAEAEREIDDAGEGEAGEQGDGCRPIGIGKGRAQLPEEVEDR